MSDENFDGVFYLQCVNHCNALVKYNLNDLSKSHDYTARCKKCGHEYSLGATYNYLLDGLSNFRKFIWRTTGEIKHK